MKNNAQETFGICRLEIHPSVHDTFTTYHLTVTVDGPMPVRLAADKVFGEIAAVLASRGIQTIQEKLYGLSAVRAEVLERREAAYRGVGVDRSIPVTWIQGEPLQGCDFIGLQIWGVTPRDSEPCVTTVENPITGRGRLWQGKDFRLLHLPGVRGTLPNGELPAGHCAQAELTFANIGAAVQAHGFRYDQVVRTWIYVRRLLEWYGDLNRIRTARYRQVGFGTPGGPAFPASTGIQGRCDDEELMVDVLAVDDLKGAVPVATPVRRSPRQDQSFNYGSAFSRGMVLDLEGKRTVHISGTASINTAGLSTHQGDAECQSLETLMSIAAILHDHGGSLRNITSATLFCKDRASWEAWNRVSELLDLPPIPKICVLADVCRDNLLVEMEAVAVI